MESGYFNNGNFREYSYFAGGILQFFEAGIHRGPDHFAMVDLKTADWHR